MLIWSVAAVLVLPVSWRLAVVHGKPLELVPSDLLLLALPVCIWSGRRRGEDLSGWAEGVWLRRLCVALTLYCGAAAVIGCTVSGDAVRLLSAANFVKPFLLVFVGQQLARVVELETLLRRIGWAVCVMSLVMLGTAAADGNFPLTGWGSRWLGLPVLGYPNLAMAFLAAMLPLVLAVAETSGSRGQRILAMLGAATMFALIVTSLSRCAAIVMVSGLAVYFLLTGGRWISAAFVGLLVLYVGTAYSLLVLESDSSHVGFAMLQERASHRFVRPVNPDSGPLAGRSTIWQQARGLIVRRPVFGYAFEPYSSYSPHGSLHQQYLEVLYKSGAAGLLLYLGVLMTGLSGLLRRRRHAPVHSSSEDGISRGRPTQHLPAAVPAMLCGVLVGNFSQSNLTYAVTGNCLFLILGLMLPTGRDASAVKNARS